MTEYTMYTERQQALIDKYRSASTARSSDDDDYVWDFIVANNLDEEDEDEDDVDSGSGEHARVA